MILTSHILAGAAIASKTNLILPAIILSFFSHYLLDFIPHSEYSVKNILEKKWKRSCFTGLLADFLKILLDFSAGILAILIFSKNPPLALMGGFAAILPDGLTFLNSLFPDNRMLRLHQNFHHKKAHFWRNKKIPPSVKFIAQFSTIIISIFFLLQ